MIKNKILLAAFFVMLLLFVEPASAVNVNVYVDNSASNYPSGVSPDQWSVMLIDTLVTSIGPGMIAASNKTNSTGGALLSVAGGTYYVMAVNYKNASCAYSTPQYMGVYSTNPTTLGMLDTSNSTSAAVNDFSNASALRGYVNDTAGSYINGAKAYAEGSYRGVPIPSIPAITRTFVLPGYYAFFLPLNSSNYTIKVEKSGYQNATKNVTLSQGYGCNASELVNVTLSIVDNSPPTITIRNPLNGSVINILNNTIYGEISDASSLKNVTLILNGVLISSWTSKGNFTKTANYSIGNNTINITATDVYENTATAIVQFNVSQPVYTAVNETVVNGTVEVVNSIANTSAYIEFLPTSNGSVNITINATTNASQLNATDLAYAVAQNQKSIDKYIKIEITGAVNTSANLSWALIRLYYSDADLDRNGDGIVKDKDGDGYVGDDPGDINENSLKLYRYCGAESKWNAVVGGRTITCGSDSVTVYGNGVNSTGNYIWANLSHFSEYGAAGDVTPSPTTPPSGGDGGWTPPSKPAVTIVANSIDKALAEEFFGFLKNQGIDIGIVNATEFEKVKTSKFIIILGGPDAPEGIGEIVKKLIAEDEQKFIRAKGNRKMYTITNKYATGQVIHILAGSDRNETKNAHAENRNTVAQKIKE